MNKIGEVFTINIKFIGAKFQPWMQGRVCSWFITPKGEMVADLSRADKYANLVILNKSSKNRLWAQLLDGQGVPIFVDDVKGMSPYE
jgi:hypothetical protein